MKELEELEALAQRINDAAPNMKGGTLRFWGQWFGRPYDNWHQIVAAEIKNNALLLLFDEGETLTVWKPLGVELENRKFRITNADRVLWEWHYYGSNKISENRYFMDFKKVAAHIVATTDADWIQEGSKPTLRYPAVEMLQH